MLHAVEFFVWSMHVFFLKALCRAVLSGFINHTDCDAATLFNSGLSRSI